MSDKTTLCVWNFQVIWKQTCEGLRVQIDSINSTSSSSYFRQTSASFTTELLREQEGFETNEPKGSVRKNHDDKWKRVEVRFFSIVLVLQVW